MTLKIAVQMDPIEAIDIAGDSTFALMLEAQMRGHDLFEYHADTLALRNGKLSATGADVKVRDEAGKHFEKSENRTVHLEDYDVVLMRQDPPFDMNYITATHMLEHIHPKTLVVNDPAEVRNAPEKLFVTAIHRTDAADADHARPAAIVGVPRRARRHHRQAALRQWRRRCFPPGPGDENLAVAAGNVHPARSASRSSSSATCPRCGRATSASS